MGFLRNLALASLVVSTTVADGLNARAAVLGKYMGIEFSPNELNDAAFTRTINNRSDFGFQTPVGAMNWDVTEPSRNVYNFAHGDRAAAMARQTGRQLHCGPLVSHAELPGWVARGGLDNATLLAAVRQRVATTVRRYGGACARWDVVGGALAEDGGLRDSVLSRTTGGDAFVAAAFAAAADADADAAAALYLADYNLEAWASPDGRKAAGARRLAAGLRRRGLRVDGVALQSHLGGGPGAAPASAAAFRDGTLRPFVDAGFDVVVAPLESGAGAAQSALDYARVVAACADLPRCVGVGMQRLADLFSRRAQGFQTTPAYTAILDAWGPAPAA